MPGIEERRASAISGRAWQAWDKPVRSERPMESDAGQEQLRRELEDLRATNAKLAAALLKMKADNDRLSVFCRTAMEIAFGEDWADELREVWRNGTDHDDQQGDAGAPAGE